MECTCWYSIFQVYIFSYTSYIKIQDTATSYFISCFTLAFTLSDTNFFRTFRTSSKKKDFWHKFSFFTGFMQLPNPFNSQSLLSMTKVFVDSPLILYLVMKKVTLLSDHTIPCKKSYFFLVHTFSVLQYHFCFCFYSS